MVGARKPTGDDEWERFVLQFIGSLTLCDHMGDVTNDVDTVLKRLGYEVDWDEMSDLADWLAERGVTTLQGTSLEHEPE